MIPNIDIGRFTKDPGLLIELCREVIDRIDCAPDDAKTNEKETQLREIAKAVEKLEKMGVPVPDALRAEKTRLAVELGSQTQAEQTLQHLAKELDGIIKDLNARLKKQGLPVPTELNELKLKLYSEHVRHQERIALYQKLNERIGELLNRPTPRISKRTQVEYPNPVRLPHRKPSNYEKPLGSKGYSNLEDYLIPVVKLMWNGLDHKEAFRKIAQKLDVRYNTVSSQCTRALGLKTDEFIRQVNSKAIINLLERTLYTPFS
jgi:hypothetical protein